MIYATIYFNIDEWNSNPSRIVTESRKGTPSSEVENGTDDMDEARPGNGLLNMLNTYSRQ